MTYQWTNRRVLVTGGASFIGSHLVDALVARGARVRVVDDLSSGSLDNLAAPQSQSAIEFIHADLREPGIARSAMNGMELVFHLAADHGGRGYVETHQAGPASNLLLDGLVFWEAVKQRVKVVFASSGCVYPNYMQMDPAGVSFLSEDLVKPPYDADNNYGWAKLMGELTLRAYHKEFGLSAASLRYFTVYGPRAKTNQAVMGLIAKAFVGQNPIEVWGNGNQVRNWTYVDDIVEGTLLAAEKIDDATAVNLGTMEQIRILDAVGMILNVLGHTAEIVTAPDMPVGPLRRVCDNSLAKTLLGWTPRVAFRDGLKRTIEWFTATHSRQQISALLAGGGLIERKAAPPLDVE